MVACDHRGCTSVLTSLDDFVVHLGRSDGSGIVEDACEEYLLDSDDWLASNGQHFCPKHWAWSEDGMERVPLPCGEVP